MPLRNRKAGHLVTAEDVVVLHLLSHPGGVGHRLGHQRGFQVVGEEAEHLGLAADVLGAGVAQPLFVTDQLAGEHAEQGVVGLHITHAEVVGVVGGDQRNAQLGADAGHLHVHDAVLDAAVVLDLQVEVGAEDLLVPGRHGAGHIGAPLENRLGDLTAEAGGGHDQTLAVLAQQLLVDAGSRKDAPAAHAAQVADAGELHQVAIADGIFGQHHQVVALLLFLLGVINGAIDDIHLIADDRLDARLGAELQQLDGAIHDAVVGQGQGRHAQLQGPLHHRRQLAGPIQEAVVAVVVERYEGQGGCTWNRTRLRPGSTFRALTAESGSRHTIYGAAPPA